LRSLGGKLWSLASRVVKELKGSLGEIPKRLKSPRTWMSLLASRLSGFRSWWLATTVAIAATVGLLVAIVLLPVAAILAPLVVAVGALVRRLRKPSAAGQQAAA
jgi:predicted cobalt transporter CbtA